MPDVGNARNVSHLREFRFVPTTTSTDESGCSGFARLRAWNVDGPVARGWLPCEGMQAMNRQVSWLMIFVLVCTQLTSGCGLLPQQNQTFHDSSDLEQFQSVATEIEYPDVEDVESKVAGTVAPYSLSSKKSPKFSNLTLQKAIRTALSNSTVLRDLGGTVLRAPEAVSTIHDPAINETHPIYGVDAALSAFDTTFGASGFFENNDRALNNSFFGGGTRVLIQDLAEMQAELSKQSATGAIYTLRKNVDYDNNNAPGNQFFSAWTVNVEAEFRQPLLQGAGVEYNRIAGPNGQPGLNSGVLLARLNTDVALADFEGAIARLVGDVENAYWHLYVAYRELDAKVAARDRALETWRRINSLYQTNRRGGEAEKEAQARAQYFRLEADVQVALSGRPFESGGSRNNVGQEPGVYSAERRLRLLLGMKINDGSLLRPTTEPTIARVEFDWNHVLMEALRRRPELRRQKWKIKGRELELVAARNYLMPRLDALGRYRWRGFGKDLAMASRSGRPRFDNAFMDLTTGDFQEWQLGFELTMPVGNRQAHAGVRYAQLQLARDKARLQEQERFVAHDLSAAFANLETTYKVAQAHYNRRMAAKQQLKALETVYESADANEKTRLLDLLLDAQRRLADAEVEYFRVIANYANAIKQVHLEKGSLLDYNEVYLSEGAWPTKAYDDAHGREHRRGPWKLDAFVQAKPGTISQGTYNQQTKKGEQAQPPPQILEPAIKEFRPPAPVIDQTKRRPLPRPAQRVRTVSGQRKTAPIRDEG